MREVYDNLLKEIHRLRGDLNEEQLQQIFTEFIYDKLTDQEVLEIIKTDKVESINLPPGLKKEAVLRQTLRILDSLKKSDSWEQFKELNKQPPKDSIDFDKLIDQILKQVKPPE